VRASHPFVLSSFFVFFIESDPPILFNRFFLLLSSSFPEATMSLQQQQPASMRVLEGQMRTMNVLGNKENATVKLSSFCFFVFSRPLQKSLF